MLAGDPPRRLASAPASGVGWGLRRGGNSWAGAVARLPSAGAGSTLGTSSAPREGVTGAGLSAPESGAGSSGAVRGWLGCSAEGCLVWSAEGWSGTGRVASDGRGGSIRILKASIVCPTTRRARRTIRATSPVTTHIERDRLCCGSSSSSSNGSCLSQDPGIRGPEVRGLGIRRCGKRGPLSLRGRGSASSTPPSESSTAASSSGSSRGSSANSL